MALLFVSLQWAQFLRYAGMAVMALGSGEATTRYRASACHYTASCHASTLHVLFHWEKLDWWARGRWTFQLSGTCWVGEASCISQRSR